MFFFNTIIKLEFYTWHSVRFYLYFTLDLILMNQFELITKGFWILFILVCILFFIASIFF